MISVADIKLLTNGHQGACTGAVRFGIVSLPCVLTCVLALEMTAQVANAHAILPHICLNNRWLWSTESNPQRPSRRAVILPPRSLSFPYRCRPPVALAISSSRDFRPLRSNRFPFLHSTTSFSHSLRPFRVSHPLHRIPFSLPFFRPSFHKYVHKVVRYSLSCSFGVLLRHSYYSQLPSEL